MLGRVTTIHLVTCARTIIHEYGWKTYFCAWGSALHGGTFLEAVAKARKDQ